MIGTRLGHYEITEKLGEGGMGVVYRAHDSQLGREVALKVLPEGVTGDPERLARFEREAKVLASLNHPNIAQIYGLETGGDGSAPVRALVMELVDGPTLAERLEQGPLPLEESLVVVRQIAEALEQAHDRGIVHRDLKPQNVKLAAEGKVKVLDFGLAKAMDLVEGSGSAIATRSPTLMNSPTLTAAGTQLGVILGTAAYMAPEQARGGAVDARADIWAFGVVLWEMLSGRHLFAADSVPDTLAGVLRAEIDLGALPATTPPAIRRLLRRCLERNPKNRLHDIADARIVLDEVLRGEVDEPSEGAPVVATPSRPRWQLAAALAGAALLGALALQLVSGVFAPAPPAPRVVRFEIQQPENLPTAGAPKLSPDGRHIAFTARDEKGVSQVWLRSLDSLEARPLAGTEGAIMNGRPFWSPDSRHVAYFTAGKLFKVPIDGGPPQKICDTDGADASWSEQGTILFDGATAAPILGVPASGGVPKEVIASGERERDFEVAWPQFLPGGGRFLYVLFAGEEGENGIWIADADGGNRRRVVAGLSRAEFAPPHWLLFVRESTLVAQRLDPESGELSGEPIPVADGLGLSNVGLAEFSVARAGVLAYRATGGGEDQLSFFDRRGARESDPVESGEVNHPAFSPDARWLAFDRRDEDGNADVWLRDLKRGVSSRLTFAPEDDFAPLFSPDGERIYFTRDQGNERFSILSRPLGAGGEVELSSTDVMQAAIALSPDGRRLVLARFPGGTADLLALDLAAPGEPVAITATPEFSEFRASFSPEGRWLAYESNESGRAEIYVQPFPGPGRKWQVSTAGGAFPVWSPKGGEIFYRGLDQRMMRVEVEAGATFDAGVPEPLFALPFGGSRSLRKYAVTPDGERFLALVPAGDRTVAPTSVIVGWDAVLPR